MLSIRRGFSSQKTVCLNELLCDGDTKLGVVDDDVEGGLWWTQGGQDGKLESDESVGQCAKKDDRDPSYGWYGQDDVAPVRRRSRDTTRVALPGWMDGGRPGRARGRREPVSSYSDMRFEIVEW